MQRVLAVLADLEESASGREVSRLTSLSPSTVGAALEHLSALGAVIGRQHGRAVRWRATLAAEQMLRGSAGDRPERRVLILTALALEYKAVRDRLGHGSEKRSRDGLRYFAASMSGEHVRWDLRVYETTMGNVAAAAALTKAAEDFAPDLILFVGVAGGIKPREQQVGDVIIVDRAFNAHHGKVHRDSEGNSVRQDRPTSEHLDIRLEQLVRSIARDRRPGTPKIQVSVESIASTEAVVADDRSELYQRIRRSLGTCKAVDMESFGVYAAARMWDTPAVSVRGLSDIGGDKQAGKDIDDQPRAARNAAAVASEILMRAHPDDAPPSKMKPRPDRDDSGVGARPIPPVAQTWLDAVGRTSQRRADAAATALSDSSAPLPTVLSALVTQPPAWLRGDDTGDAWAAVATAAEAVGGGTAGQAWARAADAAERSGQAGDAGVFRIRAALATRPSHRQTSDEDIATKILAGLETVDLTASPELEPLRQVWISHFTAPTGDPATLAHAVRALTCLGFPGWRPGQPPDGAAESEGVVAASDHVRTSAAVGVLLAGAVALIVAEDGGAALQWAQEALRLEPRSLTAQLRRDQALLTIAHDERARTSRESVTDTLARIESSALAIRSRLASFGGPTAEALALAGRARVEAGDPRGALRLLLSAPDGTATRKEAAAADVIRFAQLAALLVGDSALALELSNQIEARAESLLAQGNAFASSKGMAHRARDAYRAALEAANDDYSVAGRALIGLARLRVAIATDPALSPYLTRLRQHDQAAADLAEARSALALGDYEHAGRLARRHHGLVFVELQADALMASGRPTEAIERLDAFAQERGDLALRAHAMRTAARADLPEIAGRIADAILAATTDDSTRELRRQAREVKADLASRAGAWSELERHMINLLRDSDPNDDQSQTDAASSTDSEASFSAQRQRSYRWALIEAMYRQHKPIPALAQLLQAPQLPVTEPQQVRLTLAVMDAAAREDPYAVTDAAVDWVLSIAGSWVGDPQIGGEALGLVMLLGRNLSVNQQLRAGELLATYIDAHGDDGSLRAISLPTPEGDPDAEPDLTPLIDELRSTFEPHQGALAELQTMVAAGRVPLGIVAAVTHRPYAEILIKGGLGFYVAVPESAIRGTGDRHPAQDRIAAARAALGGRVVADTSALVVGSKLMSRRELTSEFDAVLLPASLLHDIYAARKSFSLRSEATVGWDSTQQRPMITTFDSDTLQRWEAEIAELVDDAAQLTKTLDSADPERELFTAAAYAARDLGVSLWADDVGLLALAAALHTPAFCTLDLIIALRDANRAGLPDADELGARLRAARVVDLDLGVDWAERARLEGWAPPSHAMLAISRPAAWRNLSKAFDQYRKLIRGLVDEHRPTTEEGWDGPSLADLVGLWASAASFGLARAAPSAASSSVGALLAWTALNTEPALAAGRVAAVASGRASADTPDGGVVLTRLLEVARAIEQEEFPAGDGVRAVVTALFDTLRSVADSATAAQLLASALSKVEGEMHAPAVAALLGAPASRVPTQQASDGDDRP